MDKQDQLKYMKSRLATTSLKVWKETSPLAGEPYTVMHIESVFDVLSLIHDFSIINGAVETAGFANYLKESIMKMIGREEEE